MKSIRTSLLATVGGIAAGTGSVAYAVYRKEIHAALQRIATGTRVIDAPNGPIEFAEAGDGPPALVIHGAGGGFDQGFALGRGLVGDGYRFIAPSRFGYLGTPLPSDASPEAQADAHLRVLDALQVGKAVVVGVSAGGPSAMQFALRYPERCSALVLAVPLAYAPNRAGGTVAPSRLFRTVVKTVFTSDFLFWTATRVAHSTLVKTILGTPVDVYWRATPADRRKVDDMLRLILPVSKRVAGLENEEAVATSLVRYALEDIKVPTLVISAADDGYGTYESSLYTAAHIPNAKLVTFERGGHLLVGHEAEVRSQIAEFLITPPVAEELAGALS